MKSIKWTSPVSYIKGITVTLSLSTFIITNVAAQNNALHFDGKDDRVGLQSPKNVPVASYAYNFSKDNAFSIEIWIKPDELKEAAIVSKVPNIHQSGFHGYELFSKAAGGLGFYLINHYQNGNYIKVETAKVLTPGEWTHIAVTYDGTSKAAGVKFFVNGIEQTGNVVHDNLTGEITHNGGVLLGARVDGVSNVFYQYKGAMDELRIWKSVLTPKEVLDRMNLEMMGNEANLALYYSFNQGTPAANNAAENKLKCLTNSPYEGWLMGFALNGPSSNYVGVEMVCSRK